MSAPLPLASTHNLRVWPQHRQVKGAVEKRSIVVTGEHSNRKRMGRATTSIASTNDSTNHSTNHSTNDSTNDSSNISNSKAIEAREPLRFACKGFRDLVNHTKMQKQTNK